jgi:hypothetical protein
MALLRHADGPNSVGASALWHFCVKNVAPCDWLGRGGFLSAFLRGLVGLSPWGNNVSTFLRFHNDPVKLIGKGALQMAFLHNIDDPSLGALLDRHCCDPKLAPNKTGGGARKMALPRC